MARNENDQLRTPPGGLSEAPPIEWLGVAQIVYRWTDRRDPATDRAWWRLQRARIYRPAVHEEGAANTALDVARTLTRVGEGSIV